MILKNTYLLIIILFFFISCKNKQPIKFSHKIHAGSGVECDTCHAFYKTKNNSGRPTIETCSQCHGGEPMTNSKEEKRLINEYVSKNKEIPWKRVYAMPMHAYYPHVRHIKFAKLECKLCHGDVSTFDKPITKPFKRISMQFCIDCHKAYKISIDCITCHK